MGLDGPRKENYEIHGRCEKVLGIVVEYACESSFRDFRALRSGKPILSVIQNVTNALLVGTTNNAEDAKRFGVNSGPDASSNRTDIAQRVSAPGLPMSLIIPRLKKARSLSLPDPDEICIPDFPVMSGQ